MGIKKARESMGMTQEALAEQVGVARSTVAMWESGDSLPRAQMLPKLAEILKCSINDLLKPDETPAPDTQSR